MEDVPFVVAGLDGSENSVAACRWAIDYARAIGAEVRLVGAWSVPSTIWFSLTYVESDYARDAEATFRKALDSVSAGTDTTGVDIKPYLLKDDARQALQAAAAGARALVVGAHGEGSGSPSSQLGSTAAYLVSRAECPVVVVPGTTD